MAVIIDVMPAPSVYEQTTTALLEGLRESENTEIWQEFDARYRPIIVGFAIRLGLGETDAHDVAQETMVRFLTAYRAGQYESGRGRLRSWIIGIARNCAREAWSKAARDPARRGSSVVEQHADNGEIEEIWDAECARTVLKRSLTRLRMETSFHESTVRAFEEVVVRQRQPSEVADEMGLSRNEVYLAKHRCLTKLRGLIADLTESYRVDEIGKAG